LLLIFAMVVVGHVDAQGSSTGDLTILIASPGEGETFYAAAGGYILAVPITGQVVSYDAPLDSETVDLSLEFINSTGEQVQITAPLAANGRFEVWTSILSIDRPFVSTDIHDEDNCAICHRLEVDLTLPDEIAQLVVHARSEDGRVGRAVRHFRLDRGTYRNLVVQVEGLPPGTDEFRVEATTLIYDWRRLTFYGTVSNGQATIPVEALAYADLTYEVSLEPHVVAEIHYTSASKSVVVHGGAAMFPDVYITCRTGVWLHFRKGRIWSVRRRR
jgi:hypothetical protein